MGNSSSSSKASDLAKERAYIRSLGDRFPLGDAELRKYVWCYQHLAAQTQTPIETNGSMLLSMAVWSAIYGDYNPYAKNQNELVSAIDPMPSVRKLIGALSIVEQHILPRDLGRRLISQAFGLDVSRQNQNSNNSPVNQFPTQSMSQEEILAWQSNYFSISTLVNQEESNYSLEDFLEGTAASCGRRGSRAALTKMFMLCCKDSIKMANASEVVCLAYCLTLAASYLKNVATNKTNVDWKRFGPQKSEQDTKAVVDSLINSAKNQREGAGGGFSANFDYSYSASTPTNSSGDNSTVSLDEFLEWAETTVPMISSALPTFLHVLLSYFGPTNTSKQGDDKEPRFPPGVTPLWIPSLTVETKESATSSASSSFVDPSNSMFDLFALSCTSLPLASGRWHRLFSSEANGLSCNRLMHSLLGYGGPTLILIRAKNGCGTFGAYTFTPWSQESGAHYGNSDCFLFRSGPEPFALYRPKGSGSSFGSGTDEYGSKQANHNEKDETRNYQYFNPEARSKGYDGLAHGIGFGGTPEQPRLYIDEILDGSCAKSDDLTYDNGPLLSGNPTSNGGFEVEAIEAWGVGSSQQIEEALFIRDGSRDGAAKRIRQAMKGAKGQFLEDMQAGLIDSKTFQHREQMRGRDGGCDMDRDGEDGSK